MLKKLSIAAATALGIVVAGSTAGTLLNKVCP